MNIRLDTRNLHPETIATMIADLLEASDKEITTVNRLIAVLEEKTSDEMAIEYMMEAGITPESLSEIGVYSPAEKERVTAPLASHHQCQVEPDGNILWA